jgi:hypothetical protein
MSVSAARIKLHFNIHEPIELTDLTLSFIAISAQYQKHLMSTVKGAGGKEKDPDVKLYITKIENNCILAELAGATDILGSLFSVMDYANIFVDFIQNINNSVQFFRGLPEKSIKDITPESISHSKRECSQFDNLLKVVSNTKGGELGISVIEYNHETLTEKTYVSFRYSANEALEARKGAMLAMDILEEKRDSQYKNVLMYFQQTNSEESKTDGKTGEKAIIEAIYHKPLSVYIVSNMDRERIMGDKKNTDVNPLKVSYMVDVNVEKDRNGVPRNYRVLKINNTIADDE